MADTEKPSAAAASEPMAEARDLHAEVLCRRWDEGKASGRAGPLDIKLVLVEEHATFKGARPRRG